MTQNFGTLEGEPCGRDNCQGTIVLPAAENCSCHINPPCSACVERNLQCDTCGWEVALPPHIPAPAQERDMWEKWRLEREASKKAGHILPSGGRIFDINYTGASGSTMVFTGKFEGPVTAQEIFEHLGDGTFGHRGPFLKGDGTFSYTKITD